MRNAALLVLAERGLSSAEIASLPGFELDERTIRESIVRARRLREKSRGGPSGSSRHDPRVLPLFGCQPWEPTKEELPGVGARCTHCNQRIGRGEALYCPKCAATGYDSRLARELGEALRHLPTPPPAARSKLRRGASGPDESGGGPGPPKLTLAHRKELARTPQGFLWLQSIGQLPPSDRPANPRGGRPRERRA